MYELYTTMPFCYTYWFQSREPKWPNIRISAGPQITPGQIFCMATVPLMSRRRHREAT